MTAIEKTELVVSKLKDVGFDDSEINCIIEALKGVCPECWEDREPCYCSPVYDE